MEAQEGDSTCLRAHSFKQEQALEVGCQIPHLPLLVLYMPVGAGFLVFGKLQGGLSFPYSSAS